MSKEEFLKIQTCDLKVNIHCDGCKQKVKKILQKIDGVFTTTINSEQGKVTVSGNVDPNVLIKKLAKSGKHAELWGAQKANNANQNLLANQLKNMQMGNGKGGGNNNKGQMGNNNNGSQPKSGQPNPQQQLQQLQQLQQMKAFQDLKLPQLKDLKMPNHPGQQQNQKAVKFDLPEDDDLSDDDYDLDEDDDYDDSDLDDEIDEHPLGKTKPMMGNNSQGPHGLMMKNMLPQMNMQKGAPNSGGNGKKGGGGANGALPHVNMGGGDGKDGNGGKKGGGGGCNNGGNHNQGGKNGGGKAQNGNNGGGVGGNKNSGNGNGHGGGGGGNGNNMQMNGGKKGNNGGAAMNGGFHKMGGPPGSTGQIGNMNMPMGPIGGMPMNQMGSIPAVEGLPAAAAAAAMTGGGGGGGGVGANGYFQGAGPDAAHGNPYQQQQYMQAVMNQQRAMGGERFQPMMYARPPPAVNYMPPHPYPYPYPHPYPPPHVSDPYTNYFSDENTSSCSVM